MMASWNVRPYQAGDETGINDLFNVVFAQHRPLEAWRWKFDQNPASKEKVIAVAEDSNGKIIGVYAAMPMRFRFGDRTVLATQPVDNCITADYRGGGRVQVALYREYVRRMREIGAGFGFGFPNEIAYPVGKRLLKYIDLTTLTLLDRRLSLRPAIAKRISHPTIRSLGEAIGRAMFDVRLRWDRLNAPNDVAIRRISDFSEEFDELWQQISERTGVSPIRDRAYLCWRYTDNPEGGFRILRATCEARLVGYLVGKIKEEPNGVRIGYILEAAGKDERIIRALTLHALEDFFEAKADWARCSLLPHWVGVGPWPNLGFRQVAGRMPFVYVIYDDTLERSRFIDLNQWDLSLGDSDIFTNGG